MADPTSFTDDENWHGGFYELAMRLGARADPDADQRLRDALFAVWDDDALQGCYSDRWTDRSAQQPAPPRADPIEHPGPQYGIATLPSGERVVCLSVVVRFEGNDQQQADDWLDFCIPLGALGRVDARVAAYPFAGEDGSQEWREPIDDWLATTAARVHGRAGLALGLLGFEVSGMDWTFTGETPTSTQVSYLVPDALGIRHLKPTTWVAR